MQKFKGEVRLSDIATVESLVSIANPSFGFKITFKENSKESPWTLFASSEVQNKHVINNYKISLCPVRLMLFTLIAIWKP